MDEDVQVKALAVNVAVPEALQWTDERNGQPFRLETLTVQVLPDGSLAAKAYGRPLDGARGAYTSFRLPPSAELERLIAAGAARAAQVWAAAATG